MAGRPDGGVLRGRPDGRVVRAHGLGRLLGGAARIRPGGGPRPGRLLHGGPGARPGELRLPVGGIAVVLGALVQSGVGLGLGVVAAPVVTLLDPALMPGSMLVAGAILPVFILAREAGHTDWPGVSWALAGRIAGTAAGVWLLTAVPVQALGVLVGAAVLVVIAARGPGRELPRNRWT